MRIKSSHILYCINALTILLILTIVFLPDNVIRIVIGLPFVLFFPGYVLLAALFPRKGNLSNIERFALDFGLSLAVVPLIGLLLNYLPWGLSLNSILYSLSAFVVVISVIAGFRQWKLPDAEKFILNINFAGWGKRNTAEKILSVVLVVVILGVAGVLVYTIAVPRTSEQFTEFYVLNLEGKASDYPRELSLVDTGEVTLGVVNREQEDAVYRIETSIDGIVVSTGDSIFLKNDEKYEAITTFKPQEKGDHQKVEFLLFRDGSVEPYMDLHIWVDVK